MSSPLIAYTNIIEQISVFFPEVDNLSIFPYFSQYILTNSVSDLCGLFQTDFSKHFYTDL